MRTLIGYTADHVAAKDRFAGLFEHRYAVLEVRPFTVKSHGEY